MVGTPIPENRAVFALADVAEATGGELVGGEGSARVEGVFIDSRRSGGLFVALRGERHDAHEFVAGLPEGVAAVVDRSFVREGGATDARPLVVVEDTLVALGALGRAHRRRFGAEVVAITGSAGKTTTRSHVETALRGAGLEVCASAGNLNNLVGLPMIALTLGEDDDVLVVEAGMNQPGEIARLAGIAEPTVGVVTLVARAHTEGVGGIEGVRREKTALLDALGRRGVALVNADDPRLTSWRGEARAVLRVGRDAHADVRVHGLRLDGLSTVVDVEIGDRMFRPRVPQLGEGAARAAAFALGVAHALGADVAAAADALRAVPRVPGRLTPRPAGERLVLDDAYNANPASLRLALQTARELADARGSAFLAIIGDMRELGDDEEPAHEEVFVAARELADRVITVGPAFAAVASRLASPSAVPPAGEVRQENRRAPVEVAADAGEATALARALPAGPAVVLVKGSNSLGLSAVVTSLVAPPGGAR